MVFKEQVDFRPEGALMYMNSYLSPVGGEIGHDYLVRDRGLSYLNNLLVGTVVL